MKFVPYSRQTITQEDVDAVSSVLRSEFLTQGPAVPAFEEAFAIRHEVAHGVAVCNATAGLHLGCLALGAGPGTRVWTSPNSFLASANCAVYCGAEIDFVDIDPVTRNMSVECLTEKLRAARRAGTLPTVVIPVDFSGLPADLAEIRGLAEEYKFKILEDGAHATGAEYRGRPVGSCYADATVFSFHAVKIVTTGEGGMITTQDAAVAQRLRALRSHGMTREPAQMQRVPDGPWYYEQDLLGFNYRITDIQAALGTSQLLKLEQMQLERSAAADHYDELFDGFPLRVPPRLVDRRSSWHLYVIELDLSRSKLGRREVFDSLREAGLGVNVHYIPIHLQPYYQRLGFRRGDFPNAEAYYARAITLPLFPGLQLDQQDYVARCLARALGA